MKCAMTAVSVIISDPGVLRESDHKVLGTRSRDLMKRRDESEMKFFFFKY